MYWLYIKSINKIAHAIFFGEVMDGIVLIDKEKNITSRDVVNKVSKILNTRKVGHTGTLDPLATGLLVLCVNSGCKLLELLTGHDKDYIAKVKIGIKTDTYDIDGKVIEKNDDCIINKEELINILNSFMPSYIQEVPIYSSVKVNGKKLYEYARNNQEVELPRHLVYIKNIKLLSIDKEYFSFFVTVSSGTYIRSLINDIGSKLNIPLTMCELRRTRIGNYKVEDACTYENIKVLPIESLDIPKIEITDDLYKKVSNGAKIKNIYSDDFVMFLKDNKAIAIYKKESRDIMKSYRIFPNNM